MKIEISTLHNIHSAAQAFLEATDVNRVFAFYGKMGAGKTTFIKALCEELGVEDAVNSPTFAIVNEYYSTRLDGPIFHFDFYRIKRIEEAFDIGTDDYFYSGAPCFIEWPELIEAILPEEAVRVSIEQQPDGTRTIEFED